MKTKPRPARAVADPAAGTVHARVDIAAPPERVFRALTTEELTKWWGAEGMYRTTRFTLEPRAGGRWSTEGVGGDGTKFTVEGEVLEFEPPRRLVQTWKPSWGDGALTTVTFALDPIDGGTRVTVRHTGFEDRPELCDNHQGWEQVLGWLAAHVTPGPAPRAFLLRLLPPRPSFIHDMSAEERTIMQAHGRYWRQKLGEGVALAFGPVADPAGAWGLGLVEVQDEAELKTFADGDPAIASGRGFRYESLPIVSLVH